MRVWVALLVLTGLAGPVWAEWFGFSLNGEAAQKEAAAKNAAPAAKGQGMNSARVRWLDKQTNRLQDLTLQAGAAQQVGDMQTVMKKCLADYGGQVLRDVAWLEVREKGRDTPWFAGWMFNIFPEVATLDHPRYDLHLVGCGDAPRRKPKQAVIQTEVQRIAPSADSEAPVEEEPPMDSESPAGEDPYYVPGVENAPHTEELPVREEQPAPAPAAEEAPAAPVAGGGDQDALHQLMDAVKE